MTAVPHWDDVRLPVEKDYRLQRFSACVEALRGKRVALYGTGVNAREIIEHHASTLQVVCAVDMHPTVADVAGVPVLAWEDALALGVDVVVLAAKTTSAFEVYGRVEQDCRRNGIALLDMYGNDASAVFSLPTTASMNELVEAVMHAEVISVDPRRSYRNPQFADDVGGFEPATALDLLVRFASQSGKTLVTPSGLCLPDGEGAPDVVLTESACGCVQENGYFRLLGALYPGKRIVHVGANPLRDVVCPRVYGIEGYLFAEVGSPSGNLPDSPETSAERLVNRLVRGVDAQGKDPAWLFGYRALGPAVAGFILWLAARLARQELDGVLFAARDSYLLHRAWECYTAANSGLPAGTYYLTSRAAAALPLMTQPRMVDYLLEASADMTPQDMLARKFGLEDAYVPEAENVDTPPARLKSVLKHSEAIAARTSAAKAGQWAFWRNSGMHIGGRYAFIQVIAAGTEQLMLDEYAPFWLHGYYLGRRQDTLMAPDSRVESYFPRDFRFSELQLLQIEAFLGADAPTLRGFDETGMPLMRAEARPAEEAARVREAQEGIMAFLDDVFVKAGVCAPDEIHPACAFSLFTDYDDAALHVVTMNSWTGAVQEGTDRVESDSAREGCAPAQPDANQKPPKRESTSSARRIQPVLLDLLSVFDTVCREFGLRYIATHGSLLGAVRHQGFVPWDDDLDVAMPRADYDRLLSLAAAGVFPHPYFLQTPESDAGYFSGGYAKLRNSATAAIDVSAKGRQFNQGIWMDIMPLDNCPDTVEATERQQRLVRQCQRVLYAQTDGRYSRGLWDVDPAKLSLYFIAARAMRRDQLCSLLRRLCMGSRDTGMLTVFAGNYQWVRNSVRYAASDVAQARRVPFEDTSIPIPAHAQTWLAFHYGDNWEDIPDGSDSHAHADIVYDPDTAYDEVLRTLQDGSEDGQDE